LATTEGASRIEASLNSLATIGASGLEKERTKLEQRRRRLAMTFADEAIDVETYRRELRAINKRLAVLVVPEADATSDAGRLIEQLPDLWHNSGMTERRELLLLMLDAVFVDTIAEKAVVAIRPKPAFRPLFEIALTTDESGISLIRPDAGESKECRPCFDCAKAAHTSPCSWWRRGRVELPVQRSFRVERYRLSRSI
jgi:hypothetical protein